jgi:hypothetical protein
MSAKSKAVQHFGFPDEFFTTKVQTVVRRWTKRIGWNATRAAFNVVSDCAGLDCSTPGKVGALSRIGQLDHYGKAFLLAYKRQPKLFIELLAVVGLAITKRPRSVRDFAQRASYLTGKHGALLHKEIADVVSEWVRPKREVTVGSIRTEISRENSRRKAILRKLRVTENADKTVTKKA